MVKVRDKPNALIQSTNLSQLEAVGNHLKSTLGYTFSYHQQNKECECHRTRWTLLINTENSKRNRCPPWGTPNLVNNKLDFIINISSTDTYH